MQHLTFLVKHFRAEGDIDGATTVVNLLEDVRAGILDQQGTDAGGIAEHFVERQTHKVRFENGQVQIVRWHEAGCVE